MVRVMHIAKRTLRVIRDGSRLMLPISILLMAAVATSAFQVRPQASVSAKIMVAAPRYTKDVEASLVNLDAVETARLIFRDLLSNVALRQAAYQADLTPSMFAPHTISAAQGLRAKVQATSTTDKDKVSVISIEAKTSNANQASRVIDGVIGTAIALDLKIRESVLGEMDQRMRSDLDHARQDRVALGPNEAIDASASVTASLASGLERQRVELIRQLGKLLRNDPAASDVRRQIGVINEKLRAVSLVESGAATMSVDLIEARALVEKWENEEAELRANILSREQKREALDRQIATLEDNLSLNASALELERSPSNRRVSLLSAPQLKSARLPSPKVLAVISALVVGALAWLGGTLLIEATNPRLRGAEDLVSRLSISAFAVIPDLGAVKPRRERRGPDRSPPSAEPLLFVPGSRA